jgi:GABA permease
LKIKMWGYPVLSIITIAGIVAVLVQMALTEGVREQLVLSLLAWAVVVICFFVTKWRGGSVTAEQLSDQDADLRALPPTHNDADPAPVG